MPKVQKFVEWNNEGDWVHALVIKEEGDNLTVMFWSGSDRSVRTGKPGTENGHWREPRD